MAQIARITTRQIDVNLRELWLEVDGMPETVQEWPRYNDEERSFYWFEWPDLLDGCELLATVYAADRMNSEQRERYKRLVRRYEEVLPAIEQLGLTTIPTPKLHSRR